ncbi:hypothetical protein HH297_15405, partial [Xanthomonas sp. Kuri4-3]
MPRRHDYDDPEELEDDIDHEGPRWQRRLIVWGLAALALALGFLIPYTLYLNQQVTQRFGELRWQIPTRVYARPLVLAPGKALDPASLKTELDAASYRDDGRGEMAGTYRQEGGRFSIASRGYVDVDGQVPARDLATRDAALYARVVDALSMRNFLPGQPQVSGHDRFFSTFGKFGVVDARRADTVVATLEQAARDRVGYVEIIANPPQSDALGRRMQALGW